MFERLFNNGEKETIKLLLDIILLHTQGNLTPNTLVAMKQERIDTGEIVTVLAIKAVKQDNPDVVVYLPICEMITDTSKYMPAPHSDAVNRWLRDRLGNDFATGSLGFESPFTSN